jgi:hypothetical protein
MSQSHPSYTHCHAFLPAVGHGACEQCGYVLSAESRRTLRQLPGRTAALLFSGLLGACSVPSQLPDTAATGSSSAQQGGGGSSAGSLDADSGQVTDDENTAVTVQPYGVPMPPPVPEVPAELEKPVPDGSGAVPAGGSGASVEPGIPAVPAQPYGVPIPGPDEIGLRMGHEGSAREASGQPFVPPSSLEIPPVEAYGMPPMERLQVPEQEP